MEPHPSKLVWTMLGGGGGGVDMMVTLLLWCYIAMQLLVPVDQRKDSDQEEEEYALKLDQLDAKWKIRSLQEEAEQFHSARAGTIHAEFDEDDEDDEDYVDGEDEEEGDDWYGDQDDAFDDAFSDEEPGFVRFGSGHPRRQRQQRHRRRQQQERNRYPELRVENTVDGRLRVSRNVLLDTEDANEDGIVSMRVGLAVVDFPSIFERYSEHQECSLAILKMEEDEEMDTGFPFFMSESGDDDALVLSDFYNEITLKVFDDGVRCGYFPAFFFSPLCH